jgi:hypothetical protein
VIVASRYQIGGVTTHDPARSSDEVREIIDQLYGVDRVGAAVVEIDGDKACLTLKYPEGRAPDLADVGAALARAGGFTLGDRAGA